MAEEKKVTAKVIAKKTPVKAAKVEDEKTVKAEVKETVKAAIKKTPAKKAATPKKETAKKETVAKKAPSKKVTTKKDVAKEAVHFQFSGKSYTPDDLLKICKDVWKYDLNGKEEDFKTVELYVKPEENTTYYVINGDITGSFFI